jgi:DNA processing protein
MTDDREREQRILLAAASEPGDPVTGSLVDRIGPEETLRLAQSDETASAAGLSAAILVPWQERLVPRIRTTTVADILARCQRDGTRILAPGDADWPDGIDDLVDPPLVLFARGDAVLLSRGRSDRVALVGARAATGYGEHLAVEAAADLARDAGVVVSGAAFGIEAAGLRGALASGGATIGVLASGLDRAYPAGNESLIARVAESGVLVGELPPGTAPTRWRYVDRTSAVRRFVERGR